MAEIMVLTVDPEFRRKRVGTGLLRQAESWAKEQGSKYMFMFFAGCDLLPSDTFSLSRLRFYSDGVLKRTEADELTCNLFVAPN